MSNSSKKTTNKKSLFNNKNPNSASKNSVNINFNMYSDNEPNMMILAQKININFNNNEPNSQKFYSRFPNKRLTYKEKNNTLFNVIPRNSAFSPPSHFKRKNRNNLVSQTTKVDGDNINKILNNINVNLDKVKKNLYNYDNNELKEENEINNEKNKIIGNDNTNIENPCDLTFSGKINSNKNLNTFINENNNNENSNNDKNNNNIKIINTNQKEKKSTYLVEKINLRKEYTIDIPESNIEFSYKEEPNIRFKELMEDKGKSIENFNNNSDNYLFTLFDGHGDDSIAKFLQQHYDKYLKKIYNTNSKYDNNIPDKIFDSLKQSFYIIDNDLKSSNITEIGSTGTIILLTKESKQIENLDKYIIYVANVGDTRAVLFNRNNITRLTFDHRADNAMERNRIKNSGGYIINNRVNGKLMITRAFGDFEFKNIGVRCEPFISRTELKIEKDFPNYIVLATDGVWDVIKEKDMKDLIEMIENNKMKYINYYITQIIVESIIKTALDRGAWDNLSCYVIKIE